MRIILVRHGLTDANIARKYSLDDTILHESGYDVLENTKANLKKFEIDKVYTSSLIRSQQTAKLLGLEDFTPDSRINELDFGNFKGHYFEDIRANNAKFFEEQAMDIFNVKYPGGESRMDLLARTGDFLDEISKEEGNILCVSHGIAIRSCLFWILKDFANWDSFWIDNGSITVFKIENGKRLIESVNIL